MAVLHALPLYLLTVESANLVAIRVSLEEKTRTIGAALRFAILDCQVRMVASIRHAIKRVRVTSWAFFSQ